MPGSILLADDEEKILKTLGRALRDDGHEVVTASNAQDATRLLSERSFDLLIIDYLQLITPGGSRKSDGRVQEVTEITKSLKALAKELAIPIIALSQLSRAVEQREDKRPQLADLRESGSIEQDADVVMFIYREAYYLERLEPDIADPRHAEWKDAMAAKFNVAEIIISKQRHGPIGKVEVGFNPARVKFSDLDHTPGRAVSGWQGGGGHGGGHGGGGGGSSSKPFLPDGEE